MIYKTEPLSRAQIRRYANAIRSLVFPEGGLNFPVIDFLECIHLIAGDEDFYYECVPDDELPWGVHAAYDLNENCIKIKESVYLGACKGVGRDRMTIVHEIGHFLFLRHCSLQLHRCFEENVPIYCDPEWQAKCFAAELLIPADRVAGMSAEEIAQECGVSIQAARYQLTKIPVKKEKRSS